MRCLILVLLAMMLFACGGISNTSRSLSLGDSGGPALLELRAASYDGEDAGSITGDISFQVIGCWGDFGAKECELKLTANGKIGDTVVSCEKREITVEEIEGGTFLYKSTLSNVNCERDGESGDRAGIFTSKFGGCEFDEQADGSEHEFNNLTLYEWAPAES